MVAADEGANVITIKHLIGASLFALLAACVQYPTERQSVVDQRPQISFRFDANDARINDARVLVDGLDSGRVADFADGRGALRVIPGTHVVKVVIGASVILDERVYLGDGVSRPFVVK
jgi:hypothetical protein